VATFQDPTTTDHGSTEGTTVTLQARVWAPPAPALVMPAVFPEDFEVLVFHSEGGNTLVGAIELVSPSNKDRSSQRRAFATKCASYLDQGVSLVLVDIVTNRNANLHNEVIDLMKVGDVFRLPSEGFDLYAVAYRPIKRHETEQIEIWPAPLILAQPLPVLPLALNAGLCLPIDLEATYEATCQRRRIA
jgi:hypothetical protein